MSALNMKVHSMALRETIADCHAMRYATFQHQVL